MLFDAFGTLLTMQPPAPRLRESLANEGYDHDFGVVEQAIRAEIRYYKANHLRGADDRSLADLRRECAAVLARGLGPNVPPPSRLTELLLESLRFEVAPHAEKTLAALRTEGWRCAVVSNWDTSLPDTLRRLNLARWFDVVVTSASVNAAKPDAAIFLRALDLLGARPRDAIHCGDQLIEDLEGARRAGLAAVLVGRPSSEAPPWASSIDTLAELPALARRLATAAEGV